MNKSDAEIDSLLAERTRAEVAFENERDELLREKNTIMDAHDDYMSLATRNRDLLNRFCDINYDNPASTGAKLDDFCELISQANYLFSDMAERTDEELRHLSIRQDDEEQRWRTRMNAVMNNRSGS